MYSVQAWEVERMSMLQIGILGVAGVLLALQFKSGKSEYGIYISIALGMLIFASVSYTHLTLPTNSRVGIWHLYQYRSWHADLCISAWKDQSAQRCTE